MARASTRNDEEPAAADAAETVSLGGVLDFMRLLWAVDHGLQMASKRMSRRLGVTGPQRLAIRILGRFPGISAGSLARYLHIHPSTLTGILRRLEARRLIRRWTDPRDARRALFELTPKGRAIESSRRPTVEATVQRVVEATPADSLRGAQDLLVRLAAEFRIPD